MKIKLLLGLIATLVFSSAVLAQSVTVTPKKTVYTRKGKNVPREKRVFTVTYPVISGKLSPAVRKKLENSISYWKNFETTLAENLGDYHWLSDLSYKVSYDKNGILSIALTQEGAGAYPDAQTIYVNADLKTGNRFGIRDVFKTEKMSELARLIDKKLDAEKRGIVHGIDNGDFSDGSDSDGIESLKQQIGALEFTEDSFDQFYISEKGVTFIFDAGFPHVIQAAEPDGAYFFTWTELKPFVKPGSLLARFVR